MKTDGRIEPSKEQKDHAINNCPGAAVDHADDNKVSNEMVKDRTREQNNNPRNSK